MDLTPPKPVIWISTSLKDLREFPELVQDQWVTPCTSHSVAADTGTRSR